MRKAVLSLVAILLAFASARAEEALTISLGGKEQRFSAAELLARPDAATIEVPADVSYRRAMRYRAVPLVPLVSLVGGEAASVFDTLEVRALDGFVSQIPMQQVEKGAKGGSIAWLAVEDPEHPWPPLPGKAVSAGPFYIVWQSPERSNIGTEQWPYQTIAITAAQSPARRWPQMNVADDLPAEAPARRGQAVFTTQCMACHRVKGAGAADVGPDLGSPMNPTQYMTAQGLRALIRNPKAVRTWPEQRMPGFDDKALPDADLEAVIAYLTHMARH